MKRIKPSLVSVITLLLSSCDMSECAEGLQEQEQDQSLLLTVQALNYGWCLSLVSNVNITDKPVNQFVVYLFSPASFCNY